MKEKLYTAATIPVSIIRCVIGFAVMIPTVKICAVLDRFSAKLLINAGYDRYYLDSIRQAVAYELDSAYRKHSYFS